MVTKIGYKLMNRLSDVQIPRDTGDFRIISRRVIEELRGLNETHGFLRGLVAYVGFSQTFIEYEREKRYSGKGNYNRFVGSIKIGLNGIIGFSSKPLNLMAIVGALIAVMSFFLGIWYWVQNLMGVAITAGLSTTVILVTFFAGIQLLSLGLLGEYVSRIYDEVKRRPMYIIENKKNFDV
jgi:dolichol-phosphate mannosyltransferase